MDDIIFVITSNTRDELKEWVKNSTKEIYIMVNKNGKKTDDVNDVLLICFFQKGNNLKNDFEHLYLKLQNPKRSTYIVFHGTDTQFKNLLLRLNAEIMKNIEEKNNEDKYMYSFYTYAEETSYDELKGSKVLKPLANAVRDGKSKLFEDRFDWLLQLCQGKTTIDKVPWSWASTTNKILRSFLPLDIDMQALTDKKVAKEKYLQEMAKDLDELYSSKEKKNIHYRQKLYNLWYLLGKKQWLNENKLEYSPELEEFDPINEPNSELYSELCKFAGIKSGQPDLSFSIHNFLTILDIYTLENKVMEICKPLNIIVNDKEKPEKINTFHEWYCKLGEYLKRHEV